MSSLKLHSLIGRLKGSPLAKDSFWSLFGNAMGRGLSLIAGIAIARFLGSDAYGQYGMIKGTLLSIAIFSSFGLGYTATKYIAENHIKNPQKTADIHKVTQIITILFSSLIAIAVAVFSNPIAAWLDDIELGSILRWASIGVILNAVITTQIGELGGFRAYKTIARNNIIYGIFTFMVSIPFAYFWGLKGAVIALVMSLTLNVVVNEISLHKFVSFRAGRLQKSEVADILKFSLPIALQESLYSITSWAGMAIIIKLSDYSQLGLYSAASQWMAVMLFIPGALRNVALSHLSENADNKATSSQLMNRLLTINFISTFIPFLIIAIFSSFIAKLYGDSFVALPSILNICIFTAVINSMSNVLTQYFIAHGDNWFLFWSKLFRDLFSLAITWCLIMSGKTGAISLAISCLTMHSVYLIILAYKKRAAKN